MLNICKILLTLVFGFSVASDMYAQGFLHAEGQNIVNSNGEKIILRGIGTGNWMLQEGYMMQTSDVAGTQHEFRQKLVETIGEVKTDSFYNAWLEYHFTEADVEAMKSWGFNSVRVAMHYKWFTPPIEDEPVPGNITWLDKGFTLIDSLLDWCSRNEMYLILDLHGAPGGQGKEANISDYDPAKPSLWESQENKEKTIALWRNLAERYSNEPWIGGYDLINEPNWTFPEGNNSQLRNLYENTTSAIREVDTNHIIFIEGNWFATDFSGLTPPWDDNMAYSFHKYWSYNDANSLDWVINLRNQHNIPIWLGEAGENSNTWFTNLISLCEKHHIGWAWWPVKKPGINNPLKVEVNSSYESLISYWKGQGTKPTEEQAFQAVLQFAENHKIENCLYQKNVVDAMIRQPFTTATLPYKNHTTNRVIYATDYDLGRNGYAYFDTDTGNYSVSNNTSTTWNHGWSYRNDGVDIEECQDADSTNGFNIGWISDSEWTQYTTASDSLSAYTLTVRYASPSNGGKIQFLSDGVPLTGYILLNATGGWQNWRSVDIPGIILQEGTHQIKVLMEKGGFNLNYFRFLNPVSCDSIEFKQLYASSSADGKSVLLTLNKDISSDSGTIKEIDFEVVSDGTTLSLTSVKMNPDHPNQLIIDLLDPIHYGTLNTISYTGQSILHSGQSLDPFTGLEIVNNLPVRYALPGRIEAEKFYFNQGFELEVCNDANGGYNTAYANSGDYLDYRVHVKKTGHYTLNYRVATIRTNAELVLLTETESGYISRDTIRFTPTGGWQDWKTQTSDLYLEEGRYTLRLLVKQGEHNLNWFEIQIPTGSGNPGIFSGEITVRPNPTGDFAIIELSSPITGQFTCNLYSMSGKLIKTSTYFDKHFVTIDMSDLAAGIYFVAVKNSNSLLIPVKVIKD